MVLNLVKLPWLRNMSSNRAGRFCPLDYQISPSAFSVANTLAECDLLYVVGGLYGNTEALTLIKNAFEAEPARNKQMVFNGDFHWFDINDDEFAAVERGTAPYIRLRGNVETELARLIVGADEVGCGCAYPDDVPDRDVNYSNQIISQLRKTYQRYVSGSGVNLNSLPMTARIQVGSAAVAITHGDHESLAGWQLSHSRVKETINAGLALHMKASAVDVLACSHTCLPVLCKEQGVAVVNNGAAGLANFAANTAGLVTRIAATQFAFQGDVAQLLATNLPLAYETTMPNGLAIQALHVPFNDEHWQQKFLNQWSADSPAYLSYWSRLTTGLSYSVTEAMQYEY